MPGWSWWFRNSQEGLLGTGTPEEGRYSGGVIVSEGRIPHWSWECCNIETGTMCYSQRERLLLIYAKRKSEPTRRNNLPSLPLSVLSHVPIPFMLAQPNEEPAGKGDAKSAESPGSASQGVVQKRGFGAKRQLLNNWPFDSQHPIRPGRLSYAAIKHSHI